MVKDEEYDRVEAAYDALDRGDPENALRLIREADDGDDPVLRFLEGVALLDLDRAGDAVEPLRQAVAADPDDPEFRSRLALALYHVVKPDEALPHARAAVEADEGFAFAHEVLGLVLELRGELDHADRELARAAELDPEGCPPARRLTREAFERCVQDAAARLPETFRRHLDDVAVSVEPVPPLEVLTADEPPLGPDLLGLFVGVALDQQTHFSPGGELPPRIYLFQRNLERQAEDPEDLEEQIAITLYHELGHYLGLDEAELADIDLA